MLINRLGRAAEAEAVDKELCAGVLKDPRSKAEYLPQAASRHYRRCSRPRVIEFEEVLCLWDEREGIDGEKASN